MKILFTASIVALSVLIFVLVHLEPDVPAPPAVIVISIDTLRPDLLGVYGNPRSTSPALDELAAAGVMFQNAISTAPWTLPAHGSLLTGTYPRRHGAIDDRHQLDTGIPTLAELLRKEGFQTAAVVNSFYLSRRYGFARGFEDFLYLQESHGDPEPSGVMDAAKRWLSKHRKEPFFLFLHDYHLHSDYHSMDRYEDVFVGPYDGYIDGTTAQLAAVRKQKLKLSQEDRDHLVDLYSAGVRQTDADLARLFAYLKSIDRWDETLIVVTSDHGEEFFEHGGVLHGRRHFEELIRIPLLIRGPGVPAGARYLNPVSLIDVLPTLLSQLGVESEREFDGVDLSTLWDDEAPAPSDDRVLFSEADHNNRAPDMIRSARQGSLKLVFNRVNGRTKLFDLAKDPGETHDISGEYPDAVQFLSSRLESFESIPRGGEELLEFDDDSIAHLRALGYVN